MALIAGLILAAEAIRNHAPLELAVLGAVLATVILVARHLHAFRATPANFPGPHPMPPESIPEEALRTGYRKSKGMQR